MYGSIKPDIAPRLLKRHHFKPQSLKLICQEIKDLTEHAYADDPNYIKYISQEIGVINHFISDFFCVPHNDRQKYKNNFREHVAYENTLHKMFKNYKGKIEHPEIPLDSLNPSLDTIENIIEYYHQEYSSREESMLNDIKYSISVSSLVSVMIMTNMLHHSSIKTSWKKTSRILPQTA